MHKLSYEWLVGFREIVIDPVRCPLTFEEFAMKEYERDRDGNWLDIIPDGDGHSIDAMRLWTTYCAGENLDLAAFKEFESVLFTKLFAKVTMQGDGLLVEFPYLRFIPNKASARVIPVQGFIVPCDQILKALEQV